MVSETAGYPALSGISRAQGFHSAPSEGTSEECYPGGRHSTARLRPTQRQKANLQFCKSNTILDALNLKTHPKPVLYNILVLMIVQY